MNNEIMKALEILKNNCKEHEDCIGCELFDINGCYLTERVAEEYLEGDDLFTIISQRNHNKFTEKDMIKIMHQLFKL